MDRATIVARKKLAGAFRRKPVEIVALHFQRLQFYQIHFLERGYFHAEEVRDALDIHRIQEDVMFVGQVFAALSALCTDETELIWLVIRLKRHPATPAQIGI